MDLETGWTESGRRSVDDLWRAYVLPDRIARFEELTEGLAYASVYGGMAAYDEPDDPVVADALRLVEHRRDECAAHLLALRIRAHAGGDAERTTGRG